MEGSYSDFQRPSTASTTCLTPDWPAKLVFINLNLNTTWPGDVTLSSPLSIYLSMYLSLKQLKCSYRITIKWIKYPDFYSSRVILYIPPKLAFRQFKRFFFGKQQLKSPYEVLNWWLLFTHSTRFHGRLEKFFSLMIRLINVVDIVARLFPEFGDHFVEKWRLGRVAEDVLRASDFPRRTHN